MSNAENKEVWAARLTKWKYLKTLDPTSITRFIMLRAKLREEETGKVELFKLFNNFLQTNIENEVTSNESSR